MTTQSIVYTNCFICKKPEKKYRKYIYYGETRVLLPSEFYICDNCFKIKTNEKYTLQDGNTYEWVRSSWF